MCWFGCQLTSSQVICDNGFFAGRYVLLECLSLWIFMHELAINLGNRILFILLEVLIVPQAQGISASHMACHFYNTFHLC